MHRFYLPPDRTRGSRLELLDSEARHAATVLRLRPGDPATVLDGQGQLIECLVAECGHRRVALEVRARATALPPAWETTLLQALPKGRGLEEIIEKATELGVSRIVPVLTERTVPKPGPDASRKTAKWQHVAIEAMKQCGNPWLPKVETPVTPAEWINRGEKTDLSLICSLQPGSRPPRHYFEEFRREHARLPRSVSVWVGPEGDFTPEEVRAAVAAGSRPVSLGSLVLRVETAAISCLAIVNHEIGSHLHISHPDVWRGRNGPRA